MSVSSRATVFSLARCSARIDASDAAHALVIAKMRVTLEQVVVALLGQEALFQAEIVAVHDRELFPAELEFAKSAVAGDAQVLGVALERHPVPIVVPPDEGRRKTGQVIQNVLGPDISAVDKKLYAAFAQQLDRRRHRAGPVVRITENSDDHLFSRRIHTNAKCAKNAKTDAEKKKKERVGS